MTSTRRPFIARKIAVMFKLRCWIDDCRFMLEMSDQAYWSHGVSGPRILEGKELARRRMAIHRARLARVAILRDETATNA